MGERLTITILSAPNTWMSRYIPSMVSEWESLSHRVHWVTERKQVAEGDLCFILSFESLIPSNILAKNKHNLVVHASDLPNGRGWSPMTWKVLEGARSIPVTLFEAAEHVDSGPIYLQRRFGLEGNELIDELREKLAKITVELCCGFVQSYPKIVLSGKEQRGEATYYPRRGPADSRLDPEKTIAAQFDLLRVVDNEKYPAFFDWRGETYILKIEKKQKDKGGPS